MHSADYAVARCLSIRTYALDIPTLPVNEASENRNGTKIYWLYTEMACLKKASHTWENTDTIHKII